MTLGCYNNCYVAVLTNTGSTEDTISFVDCSGFTQTITLLSADTTIINFDITAPTSGNTNDGIGVEYLNEVDTMYYFSSCCEDYQVFTFLGDGNIIPAPSTLYGENFILSETSQEVKYNCTEFINEIPINTCPPISGNLVSSIINQTIVGKSDCFDCTSSFPCPQQCYGLLACEGIYDLIISSDPGLSGYVDTFVSIDITSPVIESPQTLFLVKDLGVIDCQEEYIFTYSASTGSCDCQCYIFKTPSEAFITSFVDCDDNLLQVYLPTGKTTSICSLVRPIFDTQTTIPVKLGGLCINGECPDQPVVTIKPRNECDVLTIFPMGATCLVTHPTTTTSFDGEAQLIVTGGTPPYTISWDIGSVSPVISNLDVGNYKATITDFYNDFTLNTTCVLTAETPVTTTTTTSPPLPTFGELCFRILKKTRSGRINAITLDNIPMDFDGYINGNPSWLSDDNSYLLYWNTGSTPSYWELSGSTTPTTLITSYTTQVPPLVGWNAYGDPTIQSVTVLSGECINTIPLDFTATQTPSICDNNGTISILATGGDGIYQYSLNGINFGTINIFQNLAPGIYPVHVKDGLGQTIIKNVTVGQTLAPTVTLNLQIISSNISGNTFNITSDVPLGYTVSFDLNNTSNFSYYQNPLPPPGILPTYNNIVTLTNPTLGALPLVSTTNSTSPVINTPLCGPLPQVQYNTIKQYSTPLTITNGQTITGTFTDQVNQSTTPTLCKVANGSFSITVTNQKVVHCECCSVVIKTEVLNVNGGGPLNLTPLA